MNNIIITKIWNDSDIIYNKIFEIRINCYNEFVNIENDVYFDDSIAKEWSNTIKTALATNKKKIFEISMSKKTGNGFRMIIYPHDEDDNINIEITMKKIKNNLEEYYNISINTKISLLEKFVNKITKMINLEINESFTLINE